VDSFLFLPWNLFGFCRGFVSAMDLFLPWILFVSTVESFLFLPWIPLFLFLLPFCFCLFFSRSFYYLPRNPKNVGVFWEKVHRFSENLHRFLEKVHHFLGATL
jgi:hypothetical protein